MTPTVVGIGTGPLTLLRAVRLAESGHAVTLLDQGDVPGGAWGARDLLGYGNVEFGAHLLENRQGLYRTLRNEFDVPLAYDPCESLVGGCRLPMRWTRSGFHVAVGMRALARGEFDKYARAWQSAARSAISGTSYSYPTAGAADLVGALCRRLIAAGGAIRMRAKVEALHIEADAVRVETDSGALRTSRALVASRAFAPVSIGGVNQPLTIERGICRNLVMRLRGGGQRRFSYVEVLGHPRLKRLRDLSPLVTPAVDPQERILCVQHRSTMSDDAIADACTLVADLTQTRLMESLPEVVDAVRTDVTLETLTNATLKRLERASMGRVEGLPTTDIAEGFIDRRDRLAAA